MRTILVFLAVTVSAAGCATWKNGLNTPQDPNEIKPLTKLQRQDRKMRSWVGRSVHEMATAYGPPSQQFQNGPTTQWVWDFHAGVDTYSRSSGYTAQSGWMAGHSVASGSAETISTDCREWVDVDDGGTIVSANFRGRCNPERGVPSPKVAPQGATRNTSL